MVSIASRQPDVLEFALFGPLDAFALKRLADEIRDDLLSLPQINKVEYRSSLAEEIHVEISQQVLWRYGLQLQDVAAKIADSAIEQSAGTVRTEGGDIQVTLNNRALLGAGSFSRFPLLTDASGVLVTLGDVARIREGFSDSNRETTF